MTEETSPANTFERHAQTALVLLLVALLIWVGNTTQQTSVSVAEMKVELAFLKGQLQKPHIHPELTTVREEISQNEKRIDLLEKENGKK